jgi:hypothetical protein
MIYTTKSKGKGNSVINIVWTTIQRPAGAKGNWGDRRFIPMPCR